MKERYSTLRSRLMRMISIIIVFLLVLLLLTEVYWFHNRYVQENRNNIAMAQAIGLAFDGFIRAVLQEEYAIGLAYDNLRPYEQEELRKYLYLLADSNYSVQHFLIVDSTGTIAAGNDTAAIGIDISDRHYFQRLKEGDSAVVSDFLRTRTDSIPSFIIARGFFNHSNELEYAVLAAVQISRLGRVTLNLPRLENEYFTLFDSEGRLIYTDQQLGDISDSSRLWKDDDHLLREALGGESASGYFTAPIGENPRRIGARVPIGEFGWVAGSAVTFSSFIEPFVIALIAVLVIAAIVIALMLLLARNTVTAISKSLRGVKLHLQSVAQGSYHTIEARSGLSEFDTLIRNTNRMALQLKSRELQLKESESRVRAILESLAEGIAYLDIEGNVLDSNASLFKILGRSFGEVVNPESESGPNVMRSDGTLMPVDEMPAIITLRTGKPVFDVEQGIVRADGSFVWVSANAKPVFDGTGKMIGAVASFFDITQRKEAEDALRRSEERFRELADSMPQLVWTANPDGTVDYYNSRYLDFGGIAPDENGVWHWGPVLLEEDKQPTFNAWEKSVKTGEVYQIEHRVKHADGSFHWYLSRGIPVRDEFGSIVKWYGTATNIDISKQAQAALAENEKRLRTLNENLESIIIKRTEQVRTLSRALTIAEQRERKRFSYVLHENLQQLLLGAKMLLTQHLRDHKAVSQMGQYDDVSDGVSLLEKALNTTRTLSIELNPPVLRTQGLDIALQWLANHMRKNYGLEVHLKMDGPIDSVRGENQLMLTQMVRELLANVVQHSGVNECWVEATYVDNQIRISVRDAGKGFDVSEVLSETADETRLGLFSIRERLRLFGGDLSIKSSFGEGTRSEIFLPFEIRS